MIVTNSLTAMYISIYNVNPKTLYHIIDSQASKLIMLETYRMLVRDGNLQEIEKIPVFEKIKLVDECRTTGVPFNNKNLTDAAKILHTIKFINENS